MLGFRNKAQAPFIPQQASDGANRKRAAVPDRVEYAFVAAQFLDALFSPGQMVVFFQRGALHALSYSVQSRGERLSLIQCLGRDLAGVVYPHQCRGAFALAVTQCRFTDAIRRVVTLGGDCSAKQGA